MNAASRTNIKARALTHIRRAHRTALTMTKALRYRAISGNIAVLVEAGRLIRTGDFLARIGGADLPDGQQSWFGRHCAKAYRSATGSEPLKVWARHRTTGRYVHVNVYGPIDDALYTALDSYKATRHLLPALYAEAA